MLGALWRAIVIYLVYQGAINHFIVAIQHREWCCTKCRSMPLGLSSIQRPSLFVGIFGAFCDEFVGTALLVGLIFAIVDSRNQPVQANLNPTYHWFIDCCHWDILWLEYGLCYQSGPRLWPTSLDRAGEWWG